ncbi:hypothetical protein XENOCAPTIV_007796, partial [Xenoophorus captivus]
FCLGSCSQFPPCKYFVVGKPMPWYNAQQYCRKHHTDLATFESMDDIRLETPFSYSSAWIGLWMTHSPGNIIWATNPTPGDGLRPEKQLKLVTRRFTLGSCSEVREFHYINILKTWDEARQYCQEKYTDLAKIESTEDISRMSSPFSYSWVWFGLRDDPELWKNTMGTDANSWRWSTTGETGKTDYHKWSPGEPNYGDAREVCVVMTSTGEWADRTCSLHRNFICFISQ